MAFILDQIPAAFISTTKVFTAAFSVADSEPPAVVTLPKKATASASKEAICDAINP
jgi:hypothetical protein